MSITYQKAKEKDFSEILSLSLILNQDNTTANRENISQSISRGINDNLLWVAVDENKIIGFILCEYFGPAQKYFPNSIFISELFVLEKYRKQGIGKNLVNLILKEKYDPEYTSFSVTHDPEETHLTNFYTSFGFTKIGITDVGNVMLIKKME